MARDPSQIVPIYIHFHRSFAHALGIALCFRFGGVFVTTVHTAIALGSGSGCSRSVLTTRFLAIRTFLHGPILAHPFRHSQNLDLRSYSNQRISSPSTCIIAQTFAKDFMKIFLDILGILIILAGGTFFLQGINVLPGSYMTGDPQWAINGGIMIIVGIGLIIWAQRRK